MEISCEHVWREVSNYLDGDIEPALRAAMEEHVRGCKRCAAVLDGTRNVIQLVGDERVLEVPVGFSQRMRARLEAELPSPSRRQTSLPMIPPPRYLGWIVAAAAAIILAGAFEIAKAPEPALRSEHSQPGTNVPAGLMVVVAAEGKTFHVAGCRFLHDKTNLRTIPASEAEREGYAPCVHCMKQYLNPVVWMPQPNGAPVELADLVTSRKR